jgi:hypothetical protein
MMEHVHLRRPQLDDAAATAGSIEETGGQKGVEVWVSAGVERLLRVVVGRRPHHPQEPVAGPLQASGYLLKA